MLIVQKQTYKSIFTILSFYLLLLSTFFLYITNITEYFILDDASNLATLKLLDTDIKSWQYILTSNDSGIFGRSLSMLTFIGDWLISINHYTQFKKTNLAIHLLCGCLGFILTGQILNQFRQFKDRAYIIALTSLGLWLLAPMHISTVLYSIQRMAQLSTLFILLSLIAYICFRQHSTKRPQLFNLCAIISATGFICLGLLCKENSIVGFGLILLIELFIFKFKSNNKLSVSITMYFTIPIAIAVCYLVFRLSSDSDFLSGGYQSRSFDLLERLLTQIHVVWNYLQNLILPNIFEMTVFHDDFPITKSFFDTPWTVIKLILLLSPLLLLIKRKKAPYQLILFGYAFYLCAISLESSFIPLEIYFEHRNYLPSWGFFLCISLLFITLIDSAKTKDTKIIYYSIAVLYLIAYLSSTFYLANKWSNKESLMLHSYIAHPTSYRANTELMRYYIKQRKHNMASKIYSRAAANKGELAVTLSGIEFVNNCYGNNPINTDTYYNLLQPWEKYAIPILTTGAKEIGYLYMKGQCDKLNTEQFLKILNTKRNEIAHNKISVWYIDMATAYLYIQQKNLNSAIKHLEKAISAYPQVIEPSLLLIDVANTQQNYKLVENTIANLQNATPKDNITNHKVILKLIDDNKYMKQPTTPISE